MPAIHLSPRKQEILIELAMGHDGNKCIARKLHISITTLNNHIYDLHRKAGASNKTQLVLWALRMAKRTLILETALNLEALGVYDRTNDTASRA
jgi:DNA-binding CsgD family transcriptional regulator